MSRSRKLGRRRWKLAGMTPTMVKSLPSSVMFCPNTFGEESNFRCQSPSLMSATGAAPPCSSAGVKVRPRIGFTPSNGKKLPETNSAFTCSASPLPVRLKA